MKLEKCTITFNSREYIEFLIDRFVTSPKDIQEVIDAFIGTEEHAENAWDEETIYGLLEDASIYVYRIDKESTHKFELPEI